jgi:VIT1/CCC1 family predicted Fe2+/Mn2+ transporter
MSGEDLRILRSNLEDERRAAWLYGRLEAAESGVARRLFGRLRAESDRQAAIWAREIGRRGAAVPPYRPGARARLVARLIRLLGPRRVLPVLAAMKVRGLAIYRGGAAAPAARADGLPAGPADGATAGAADRATPGPPEGAAAAAGGLPARAAGEESWHRAGRGGGALRAAVFGVNDGLVSNAGLILGVAGADLDPEAIVVAGFAGMLAGGFSMAAGEYISVRTQREFLEHQIALERSEIAVMPEEEIAELALIYGARGLDPAQAEALARRIVSDPEQGLQTLAREELGLDPEGLGSPPQAAAASFFSFAAGALLPLLPWLAARGTPALAGTVVVTLLALLAVGGAMSLFTGRRPLWSAVRMALIGSAAGAATWLIGHLLQAGQA